MIHITIRAHSTLQKVFGQPDMIISVPEDSTMREVFDQAIGRIKEKLEQRYGLQGTQELQKYFILLLNGKQLLKMDNLGIEVKEGDPIEILEPISGGSGRESDISNGALKQEIPGKLYGFGVKKKCS